MNMQACFADPWKQNVKKTMRKTEKQEDRNFGKEGKVKW